MVTRPAGYVQDQTAITLAYRNNKMIADEVLPRVSVDAKYYKWLEYDLATGFTIPDTKWSPRGDVNEVSIPSVERERGCEDYGVGETVPNDDISQSADKTALLNRKTEFLTQIIVLDREVRVAKLVQDPNSYAASNVTELSSPWSDPDSDPEDIVRKAMASVLLRPNTLVFGYDMWELFASHPKIVQACNRSTGAEGFARRADVAELFEVDKILVGEAILNIKRPGLAPEFKKAWGKNLCMLRLDPLGGPEGFPSFGWTAEFMKRMAKVLPMENKGIRGCKQITVGETLDEVISCPHLGALIKHP